MVKYAKIAITLKSGSTYYTPPNAFYVIKAVGATADGDYTLKVNEAPVLKVNYYVASYKKDNSNYAGPLDLGAYYVVIPPKTKFSVETTGSGNLVIYGVQGQLGPGEAIPAEYMARYNNQHKAYVTVISGSTSLGTNVSLAADAEVEVLSLTPKTIEKYILDGLLLAKVDNLASALSPGQLALRLYLDNAPLDLLTDDPGDNTGGIDVAAITYPITNTNIPAVSLAENPIEVKGDHTLSIRIRNVSGSAIAPATDTALTFTVIAVAKYNRE